MIMYNTAFPTVINIIGKHNNDSWRNYGGTKKAHVVFQDSYNDPLVIYVMVNEWGTHTLQIAI